MTTEYGWLPAPSCAALLQDLQDAGAGARIAMRPKEPQKFTLQVVSAAGKQYPERNESEWCPPTCGIL